MSFSEICATTCDLSSCPSDPSVKKRVQALGQTLDKTRTICLNLVGTAKPNDEIEILKACGDVLRILQSLQISLKSFLFYGFPVDQNQQLENALLQLENAVSDEEMLRAVRCAHKLISELSTATSRAIHIAVLETQHPQNQRLKDSITESLSKKLSPQKVLQCAKNALDKESSAGTNFHQTRPAATIKVERPNVWGRICARIHAFFLLLRTKLRSILSRIRLKMRLSKA
jgi:hypothetical protein